MIVVYFSGETEESVSGSEDHELLRRMQKQLLENLHLRGVPGIRKVYLSKKNVQKWTENDGFKLHKEWLLETDGTNLAEVLFIIYLFICMFICLFI